MKCGTLMSRNTSFLKGIFFIGDGGKVVYNSWSEVLINLLIAIIGAIIFGGLFILYVLFQEGLI